MKGSPFYGPRLKVRRANHHISELESIFGRYVTENMQRMGRQSKNQLRKRPVRRAGASLPENVPTILGDAVHNLKVALDHAYCILTLKHFSSANRYTLFPFRGDITSFDGSMKGWKEDRTPRPSDTVLSIIRDQIEPYTGRDLGLYELNELDIRDKHVGLIATDRVVRFDRVEHRDRQGRPTGTFLGGFSVVMSNDSPHDQSAIATDGSIKFHGDPKSIFDILFEQGSPYEGESVVKTLKRLSVNVVSALNLLEPEAG